MRTPRDNDERRPIVFTIDGTRYESTVRRQRAADLLRLAGLDPAACDLREVEGEGRGHKYQDDDIVTLRDGAQFVSVRQSAPVA